MTKDRDGNSCSFTDKITGTKQERPGLQKALPHLRPGDAFVVWWLDRLARSLTHLIETVNHLAAQRIAFRSVTENIDTSSATGPLILHISGVNMETFAQAARNIELVPDDLTALVLEYNIQPEPGTRQVKVVDEMCRVKQVALGCSAIRRDAFESLIATGTVRHSGHERDGSPLGRRDNKG